MLVAISAFPSACQMQKSWGSGLGESSLSSSDTGLVPDCWDLQKEPCSGHSAIQQGEGARCLERHLEGRLGQPDLFVEQTLKRDSWWGMLLTRWLRHWWNITQFFFTTGRDRASSTFSVHIILPEKVCLHHCCVSQGYRRSSVQTAGLHLGCASICTITFLRAVSASARLHFAIHTFL